MTREISRGQARRIAVRAQRLTAERPTDLVDLVRDLTLIDVDHTPAVATGHDVVAWSRLGSGYDPAELRDALDSQALVEWRATVRVPEYVALLRADMADWPGRPPRKVWEDELEDWLEANDVCRQDILERLRGDGPLPTAAFPDSCERPWRSSGWNNGKNVTMLLGLMVQVGDVAVAAREGREQLFDLAERVYPDESEVPTLPAEEAKARRDVLRLGALGIARSTGTKVPGEHNLVGEAGERVVVEGVKGEWRVDPGQLERLEEPLAGRTALLSPLDRLVHDRKRTTELFGFDYQLEMYKPAAKRRWGYWAMPILHGDRLVGKLDAKTDRAGGLLEVNAVHEDGEWTSALRSEVDAEIDDLARWLSVAIARPSP